MKISRCEIEILDSGVSYLEKPMTPNEGAPDEQVGSLTKFRVTTTDTLNFVFGLVEWPAARPEVRALEMVDGLEKYQRLINAGRWSLIPQSDGTWLGEVNVMRYKGKDRPTLAGASDEELDALIGEPSADFFSRVGCLAYGTREQIANDQTKSRFKRAVKIKPGNIEAVASVFAVTRVLAIMNDLGLES